MVSRIRVKIKVGRDMSWLLVTVNFNNPHASFPNCLSLLVCLSVLYSVGSVRHLLPGSASALQSEKSATTLRHAAEHIHTHTDTKTVDRSTYNIRKSSSHIIHGIDYIVDRLTYNTRKNFTLHRVSMGSTI